MNKSIAMKPTREQLMMPFLGQKVFLTAAVDDGVFLYPMGSAGTLDAFQYSDGKVFAVVAFDNCPISDLVYVDAEDLVPMDFLDIAERCAEVKVLKSPKCPADIHV